VKLVAETLRHQGIGVGPHEQGRAAIEFYTDVATVYLDA
jgi:hypothetical protein